MYSKIKYIVQVVLSIMAYGEDPNHRERDFSDQDRNFREIQDKTGATSYDNSREIHRLPDPPNDPRREGRDSDRSRQPNEGRFTPDSGR